MSEILILYEEEMGFQTSRFLKSTLFMQYIKTLHRWCSSWIHLIYPAFFINRSFCVWL